MTTYTEMLEQPQIITKIESAIGGQIVSVYLAAHLTPPIPFQENGRFKYVDPAPQKYANHLREGMKLFAELLDEIHQKTGGEDA
ncbi:hypothetical protein [Acinetobacter tjernbergiae]|uniref:Uncharacterized protein n=1 Tax=Acinetobacter tjernbergiae DSM 14971 = CIP 107465 TaxID=1120928 RepID=V2W1I4_9GAMM|nr:hypothetical protein [Acinetobacter tjernbergiae]ESK53844.1 hypothetical protein F990_03124 [Acinetobacter tjernbergiae DSM 14971 = CIP 107465]